MRPSAPRSLARRARSGSPGCDEVGRDVQRLADAGRLAAAAARDDRRALRGEQARRLEADAAGRAGDEADACRAGRDPRLASLTARDRAPARTTRRDRLERRGPLPGSHRPAAERLRPQAGAGARRPARAASASTRSTRATSRRAARDGRDRRRARSACPSSPTPACASATGAPGRASPGPSATAIEHVGEANEAHARARARAPCCGSPRPPGRPRPRRHARRLAAPHPGRRASGWRCRWSRTAPSGRSPTRTAPSGR